MKNVYSPPAMGVESFELSTHIAYGCERPGNMSFCTCGFRPHNGAETVFTGDVPACIQVCDSGEYEGVCYRIPSVNNCVFNS